MDKSTENDAYDESKEKPRSVSRAKKLPAHMINKNIKNNDNPGKPKRMTSGAKRGKYKKNKSKEKEDIIHLIHCELCDSVFTRKFLRQIHIRTVHQGKQNILCHICNKPFWHPWYRKRHIQSVHEKLKPIKCDICGKSFSNAGYLKKHKNTKKACKVQDDYCQIEENKKPNNNVKSLNERAKTSQPNNEKQKECDYCKKGYTTKYLLQKHMKECPKFYQGMTPKSAIGAKRYSDCRKNKSQKEKEHNNFPCPKCPKLLKTKKNLKFHLSVVHEGNVKSTCQLCGNEFTKTSNLKRHILNIHEKRKDHSCQICGKAFFLESNLTKHIMAIHHVIKNVRKPKLRNKENQKQSKVHLKNAKKNLPPPRKTQNKKEECSIKCQFCGKYLEKFVWLLKTYQIRLCQKCILKLSPVVLIEDTKEMDEFIKSQK